MENSYWLFPDGLCGGLPANFNSGFVFNEFRFSFIYIHYYRKFSCRWFLEIDIHCSCSCLIVGSGLIFIIRYDSIQFLNWQNLSIEYARKQCVYQWTADLEFFDWNYQLCLWKSRGSERLFPFSKSRKWFVFQLFWYERI